MPDEPLYPPDATPGPAGSPPPTPPYQPVGPPAGELPGVAPTTTATTTGLEPNIAAGLAVLFSLVSGIVFLVLEKRSQFVRFWAMQSVVVGAAWFAFNVVSWILGLVLAHIPVVGWFALLFLSLVGLVVSLGALILYVIMLIKAFTGEEWEIPFIGKFARQQLVKYPV